MLTASESVIYGRFGYGAATWKLGCHIDRGHARFARSVADTGRVRLVPRGEADPLFQAVYERARPARAGMVSRPDFWWPEVFWIPQANRALFDAVHEDADGLADGFVSYEVRGEWYGGFADRELVVWDLQATNATARAALWEFVFGVDLVVKIIATNLPIDEPLRFMLADPRQLRTDFVNDSLYVLPLEVATLLSARTYASDGVLTIEVVEPGGPKGRFVLDGSPDGASCREAPDATPELTCSAPRWAPCCSAGTAGRRCSQRARSTSTPVARSRAAPTRCSPAPHPPATHTL